MIPKSLEQSLAQQAQSQGFAYRAVDIDLLAWLLEQPAGDRVLHHDAKGAFALAGSGVAQRLWLPAPTSLLAVESALLQMQRELPEGHPGWVGGVRFQPEAEPSEEWKGFGAAHFVMPQRVVFVRDGQAYFGVTRPNLDVASYPKIKAAPTPNPRRYEDVVEDAIARLKPQHLDKVVMATCRDFDISINIESTFSRLRQAEKEATLYWLELGDHGFFGATPERLYVREGKEVEVDALAGTAALGEEAGQTLLHDDKERREHEWVKRYVCDQLGSVAEVEAEATPHLFALSRLQHLRTRVQATLHEERSLLSVLHPTPAVCGTPTARARQCIDELEGFDRGLYAGAFGCVGQKGERFHVALRCALYGPETLRVYGGAGIVEGSSAAREASEVKRKTSALLEAVHSDEGGA